MSFFRTYIDEPIQKELFNRIDSINFQKSPEGLLDPVQSSIQHQFVKSCWARASIVLGKKDGNKVVSLNSNISSNGNPINEPLNIKDGKAYRGRPGITSISTSFKEYFMKQGTISFFVPDPNEFDLFKKQFLKFGRYMLVEFGWSLPYNLNLDNLNATTVLKISKDINKRIVQGKGNYNAFVGVVTNYSFVQTKEGAYEGQIELSSMGRNILEQKSSTDGKIENLVGYVNEEVQEDAEKANDEKFKKIRKTFVDFNSVIKNLEDVVEYYVTDNKTDPDSRLPVVKDTPGNVLNKSIYKEKGALLIDNSTIFFNRNEKLVWVTWGWFEDFILNSFFSFVSDTNVENETFRTEFFSANTKNENGEITHTNIECKSHPKLLTLSPNSIVLPNKTQKIGEGDKFKEKEKQFRNKAQRAILRAVLSELDTHFPAFESEKDKRGQIRNMVFNVKYLKESFKSTDNIERSLKNFWQKVSNDYGGFWRFSILENSNVDGRIMITDMNIGEVDDRNVIPTLEEKGQLSSAVDKKYEIFEFPVYSNKSIVSDLSLTTSNTSEMATLAVYGSNVNLKETSADDGKGYTTLAMRALSMLDNNTGEPLTLGDEEDNQYFDSILKNITNPVQYNLKVSDKNSFEGASATYKDDGSVDTRLKDSGIKFKEVPKVLKDNENIINDLTEFEDFKFYKSTVELEEKKEQLSEQFRSTKNFWPESLDNGVQIYSAKTGLMFDEYKRTMLFLINKAPGEESNYSSVPPIVPLQMSLTIQGIGGIKVGDLFYIRYLPERYRNYCHFMVVNVEHEITPAGWTTKLDSRMIVDIPKLVKKVNPEQIKPLDIVYTQSTLSEAIKAEVENYGFVKVDTKLLEEAQQNVVDLKNDETTRGRLFRGRFGRFI